MICDRICPELELTALQKVTGSSIIIVGQVVLFRFVSGREMKGTPPRVQRYVLFPVSIWGDVPVLCFSFVLTFHVFWLLLFG